jgi:hypothetical protein
MVDRQEVKFGVSREAIQDVTTVTSISLTLFKHWDCGLRLWPLWILERGSGGAFSMLVTRVTALS